MFACPVCRGDLNRTAAPEGIVWICPTCKGRAVNLSILRRAVNRQHFNRLWQTAWEGAIHTARKCPACDKPMVEVPLMPPPDPLVLDACRSCQFVWFDAGGVGENTPVAAPAHAGRGISQVATGGAGNHCSAEDPADGTAQLDEALKRPEPTVWWEVLPAILDLIAF